MHKLWDSIIEPLLSAVKPGYILEIGCDFGVNTKNLLEFCMQHGAVLHAVDPAPQFDVAAFEENYPGAFFFHKTLSLNVIDRIEHVDVALIDGDHNWYTVINELRMIEHSCDRHNTPFPLILTHDVGWPYARRDLYYDPDSIPEGFRKPYQKKGILPDQADLADEVGLNAQLCNAIHENTFQNGVLTAVEDFLRESKQKIKFLQLQGLNGLGILLPQHLPAEKPGLDAILNEFDCGPLTTAHIEQIEAARIDEQIQKNRVLFERDKAVRQRDQQLGEAKHALREREQQLNESKQALRGREQQIRSLDAVINQRDKHLVEARQAIQATEQKINGLETKVSGLKQQTRKRQDEISKLKKISTNLETRTNSLMQLSEEMNHATLSLLQSRRWRLGNTIGEIIRKLRLKPSLPMATDLIQSIQHHYLDWKKNYDEFLMKQRPKPQAAAPVQAASNQLQSIPAFSDRALGSVYLENSELYHRYRHRSQEKLVSVIMPTYNDRGVIDKAIGSVLGQYYRNVELIIVDDGSTDGTQVHVTERYADAGIRYHYIENNGVAYARNQGLKLATGDYIAYLDSDNQWYPEYLTVMVNMLEDHPELQMAYCAQEIYDNELPVDIRFQVFNRSLLMNKNYIDINCVIHKRSLYDEHGGFDAKLPRLEDWDLVLRYTRSVYPLCVNAPLVRYYRSDHYKNPYKDPRREAARKRLQDSIARIQAKLQTHVIRLNALDGIPAFSQPLFSPPAAPEVDLKDVKVSIIIPNYEALDCLKLCIEAIQTYTPESCYELIIVDNASSEPVVEYLRSLAQTVGGCRVIFNETNMGFTYAVNQGLSAAPPTHDVVLLNNDAIVTQGWLQAFAAAARDVPDAGIIAPQQVLPANTQTMQVHVPYCTPVFEVDVTVSAHHRNLSKMNSLDWGKGYMLLDWATFFCVYITRACLDANGLLDHRSGRHFKSDKRYCFKVNQGHRFDVIYTPRAKVYHLLQQATKDLKRNDPKTYHVIYEKNTWENKDLKDMDGKSFYLQ